MGRRFSSQPVSRLLILSMVLVALVPLGLLALHLYKTAWKNSWREIEEKHQLLAENLAAPISIYIDDYKRALALLIHLIEEHQYNQPDKVQDLLEHTLVSMDGFLSLTLIDNKGKTIALTRQAKGESFSPFLFKSERCYVMVKKTNAVFLSGIKRSPFTREPTIMIGMPMHGTSGELVAVLMGELRVELIEQLRRKIKFGIKGHSAIIDQNGRVIAHPNPDWMREMKDLSSWEIVQAMKRGEKGVTEFYSSFMQQTMVAGYSAVPEIGWGVMVPQPKSEVEARVDLLMKSYYTWGIVGLVVAIFLATVIARWITGPLYQLANASRELVENDLKGELPGLGKCVPVEVKMLAQSVKTLVSNLQNSRLQVELLNQSLQQRVDEATEQLREANEKLQQTATSDHLTSLSNRRHFETELNNILSREVKDENKVCLLLIDIDEFKSINDKYGHAAGDIVLTSVARVLEDFMRPSDIVARYAGDEFVSHLHSSHDVALRRAEEIREAVEKLEINWKNELIKITVSIGVYCEDVLRGIDMKTVMDNVDSAMYQAKKEGRNCVKDYRTV